jgi:trypsin
MSAMGRRRFAVLACLASALLAASAARAQSPEPRVIGGSTTTIEQYPWQAAVVYDPAKAGGNPFQRQFCGGSLITPYIVLTAAHCVFDTDPDPGSSSLDPDDVNIVLGQTTLSSAPPASEFDVQGVSYQDNYEDSYGHPSQGVPSNDVGYIVLESPYNGATPIDIAASDEGALWDPASPEEITGWGATAESGPGSGGSDTLRVATVPIVADSSCAADYGAYFNSSTMVCAGYAEGEIDTCFGDSGGPMQAALQGGGYRLVGITSWGEGCAQPDAPGVYARVAGDGLRSAVASKVFDLEAEFGLPHESIVGSGGQPANGGADTDLPEMAPTLSPSVDSVPPVVRLSAWSNRRAGGEMTLEVGCDEDCTAVAVGLVVAKAGKAQRLASISARKKRKFKLTAARVEIAAGGSEKLKLKLKGKKAQRAFRKLVRRGAGAKAKINVTFADRAGNSTTEKLIVKLKN